MLILIPNRKYNVRRFLKAIKNAAKKVFEIIWSVISFIGRLIWNVISFIARLIWNVLCFIGRILGEIGSAFDF